MFTYVIVLAVSAFVPYVATPAAEAGVKAVISHHNDMETSDTGIPTLVALDTSAKDSAAQTGATPDVALQVSAATNLGAREAH